MEGQCSCSPNPCNGTCNSNAAPLICVAQGSDLTINVAVSDQDGAFIDLTSASAYATFTQRDHRYPDRENVKIYKSTTNPAQIVLLAPTGTTYPANRWTVQIYLLPADTGSFSYEGENNVTYDVWVKLSTGKLYRVLDISEIEIDKPITTQFI